MTLKDYRKSRGYSQKDLADKADLSLCSVVRYESGEREPVISTAYKLFKALDIPPSEIFNVFGVDRGV